MVHVTTGPQYVSWNYTYVCNFNCDHCYSRASSYPPELSTTEYMEIADQFIAAQVFTVALGGGEVLIRRDCLDLIARMSGAGIQTLLTTNGWFVDGQMAGRLHDAGLDMLYISLDSPYAADHDNFRNRQGSYDRVMRALQAAVGAGLNVSLSTVLTATNAHALTGFVEIAEREGLQGINFKRFRPAGNGLLSKDRYQLRNDQGGQIEEEIARLRDESSLEISLNYGPEADGIDAGCSCGVTAIAVRPNGDVSPCAYSEAVVGNLTRQSLRDLWQNSPYLQTMRSQGGCTAQMDQPLPSNPYLRGDLELLPVLQ